MVAGSGGGGDGSNVISRRALPALRPHQPCTLNPDASYDVFVKSVSAPLIQASYTKANSVISDSGSLEEPSSLLVRLHTLLILLNCSGGRLWKRRQAPCSDELLSPDASYAPYDIFVKSV